MRHSRRQIESCAEVCAKTSPMSMETNASALRLLTSCVVVGDDKTFWHLLDAPQSPNARLTMRRKRLQHVADTMCQMFCGWCFQKFTSTVSHLISTGAQTRQGSGTTGLPHHPFHIHTSVACTLCSASGQVQAGKPSCLSADSRSRDPCREGMTGDFDTLIWPHSIL